jgi:hypothetical protein
VPANVTDCFFREKRVRRPVKSDMAGDIAVLGICAGGVAVRERACQLPQPCRQQSPSARKAGRSDPDPAAFFHAALLHGTGLRLHIDVARKICRHAAGSGLA